MLRFVSTEFEKEIKDCLSYVDEKEKGGNGLGLDFYDINSEEFDPTEYDDVEIDENFILSISPDYSDIDGEMTLGEFIDLINETKKAKLINGIKCITEKRCLTRVSADYYDYSIFEPLFNEKDKIFEINSAINSISFSCSLVAGITIFGIMVNFSDEFDKYCPSVLSNDIFIEVIHDQPMSEEDINKVINAYIFELDSTHNIRIRIMPRPDYLDYVDEDEITGKDYVLRPLLFGKGIEELLSLFIDSADCTNNYDYSIIQYTKVIEYVSQTVIRQEITNKAQKKLLSPKALAPNANYIQELENLFVDFKQKYDTDRSAIKITIKKCCDIFEIIDIAPKYLNKIVNLKNKLNKEKVNKEEIIETTYNLLVDSISDTRNYIAHAKANYNFKGNECPNEQKKEFVNMLRILAIQSIRWFSTTSEGDRIVPE